MVGTNGPVAAIDCGTNSTRLLVADADGRPLERLARITRLGAGVDQTERLAADAIARTVTVLEEFRVVMDRLGVTRVRMTATSAARDASNREQFFAAATAAAGTSPELLSGDEEGALSFAGATKGLPSDLGPLLVVDIGGGSTEFVVGVASGGPGQPPATPAAISVDMGCVRLTERHLRAEPPTDEQIAAAYAQVDELLDAVEVAVPAVREAGTLLGLAGTVITLAAIDLGLVDYDRDRIHHHHLARGRVRDLTGQLLAQTPAQRRAQVGLEPARADVIAGGAIVLDAVMSRFAFEDCWVSEADILDGLAASLLT